VNADFFLDSSRTCLIRTTNTWNSFLIENIPPCFLEFIRLLNLQSELYRSALHLTPPSSISSLHYEQSYKKGLKKALETIQFLPSFFDRYNLLKASDIRIDGFFFLREIYGMITRRKDALELDLSRFLNPDVTDKSVSIVKTLLRSHCPSFHQLDSGEVKEIVESLVVALKEIDALEWYQRLLTSLFKVFRDQSQLKKMKMLPVIGSNDFFSAEDKNLFFIPENVEPPPIVIPAFFC